MGGGPLRSSAKAELTKETLGSEGCRRVFLRGGEVPGQRLVGGTGLSRDMAERKVGAQV